MLPNLSLVRGAALCSAMPRRRGDRIGDEVLVSVMSSVLDQRSVLVVFALCALLFGALGWVLAVRCGWARISTLLATTSLALAVSVTQARHPLPSGNLIFTGCTLTSPGSGDSELLLNIGLLVPFGIFASLTTGRIVLPMLCCLAVSAVFEAMQGVFGTGFCVAQDAAANSVGGICAAVVGGLVVRGRRTRAVSR